MNKQTKERLGTIGLDRNIVDKVKVFCAKQRLSIRAWVEKVLTTAMERK